MKDLFTENPTAFRDRLWQFRHLREGVYDLERSLQTALSSQPEYSTLWRASRLAHFQAMQSEEAGRAAEALRFFEAGKAHAQKALELNRHDVEGHFWLGVNALEWARRKGRIAVASTLKSATGHIERAMNQDEEYHFAGPVRVWARIMHFKPLVLGGSLDRALDIYGRALQIAPHNSTTLLYYTQALLADQQKPLARKILHQIIDAPENADWIWEQQRDKRLANAHLEKMNASS